MWAEETGWYQEVREEAVCWNLVRKEVVTPQQYHFTFLKNLAFFIRECISLSEASLSMWEGVLWGGELHGY